MTAKPDFDPREAPMNMRDNMRMNPGGDQDSAMALYQSAYQSNPEGRWRSDCFPRNFPNNLPDFNNGDLEIPHCWPRPRPSDWNEPTEAQTTRAETKLDKGINGLIPDADQQNLKDANHALLTGDATGLSAVYEKYKDDPAKLQAFVQEQNRELSDANSDVGVKMTDDGKIYVSKERGMTAVEIDPATGETSVRKVMHGPDGEIYVGDKADNGDPQRTLDLIGNHAINDINEPNFRFSFALQHDRMRGYFKHAFLLNAQSEQGPQDEMEGPGDPNQFSPNPQVMLA
ncbi:MAG: hypothetical protein JST44_04870 [Cyanobacteria bacterium SZAS LIN-5]|nr:hypothetical protein [Cyanobacteria bacterium SZAS LIN-5]